MSDQNPPEQPSFNRPAGEPTTPLPSSPAGPSRPADPSPTGTPPSGTPQTGSTPPPPPPPSDYSGAPTGPSGFSGPSDPSGPSGPSGSSGMASMPNPARDSAGFFTALFDFSFTNFVTPILVRFVYLLATVALVATWLVLLLASFLRGFGSGLSVLVLGPIFLVIYLAVIRMTLEFYLSVVRMSEDIHKRLPQA
jgi:hypothetical protein